MTEVVLISRYNIVARGMHRYYHMTGVLLSGYNRSRACVGGRSQSKREILEHELVLGLVLGLELGLGLGLELGLE